MIMCLGLIVGIVESAEPQDFVNTCAKFLHAHKYLAKSGTEFTVDGKVLATVKATADFGVLFHWHNGRVLVSMY